MKTIYNIPIANSVSLTTNRSMNNDMKEISAVAASTFYPNAINFI